MTSRNWIRDDVLNSNSSMSVLYNDGTARRQFTPCRVIAEIAKSGDKSGDKISVPPLKRVQNVPATELSKPIEDRSKKRGCGRST
jgi:hypothetical protein